MGKLANEERKFKRQVTFQQARISHKMRATFAPNQEGKEEMKDTTQIGLKILHVLCLT